MALPEAMAYRVLRKFLAPVPELAEIHLSQALALAQNANPSATFSLPGSYVLARVYDGLVLRERSDAPSPADPAVLLPGSCISWGSYQISCELCNSPRQETQNCLFLSPEHLHFPLTIRTRQSGDRIRLPGGRKKLSRWMVDQKIPAALRNQLPVLVQGQEVLAVLPYVVAAPYRSNPGSTSLILTVKRTEEES